MQSHSPAPAGRPRQDDDDLFYPASDGEPMNDSEINMRRMMDAVSALRQAMRRRGVTAYVWHDMLVYPVKGKPWLRNAPDVFVAPGCDERERDNFKYWQEPGRIEFAGEFLSVVKRRRIEDTQTREQVRFYAEELATRELFVYEPGGKGRRKLGRFVFYRLGSGGRYEPVATGPDGWYRSEVLGLEFTADDDGVWFRDPQSHEVYLPDRIRLDVAEKAHQEAERRLAAETAARQRLEQEVEALRAKLRET